MAAHRLRDDKGIRLEMKTRVFLDTNFLMMPHSEGIDVFTEIERLLAQADYELVTLSTVKEELLHLSASAKGKDKAAAKLGLDLLSAKKVSVIEPAEKKVDKELIRLALEGRGSVIVCTNDKELRGKVKEAGGLVISMRSRSHLEFV